MGHETWKAWGTFDLENAAIKIVKTPVGQLQIG